MLAILATPGPVSAADPLLVYGELGIHAPRYRTWNGSAWSSESSAPDVGGDPHWIQLVGCPDRDETALLTLDEYEHVNFVIWNGSSWGSVTELSTSIGAAIPTVHRPICLAYEQSAGDLLIAYSKGSNDVYFRTWDGTSLSSESSIAVGGQPRFVALVPKAESDEIMMMVLDSQSDLNAALWNGSAFGSVNEHDLDVGYRDEECFSFAWESASGDGLVVYNEVSKSTPTYRTWNGSSWSSAQDMASVGTDQRFVRLVSDPVSNEILLGVQDNDLDINVARWSGSSWSGYTEIETNTDDEEARMFDVAYEPDGGDALIVYTESGSNTAKYRTWDGSNWSSESNGPAVGTEPQVVQLRTGATSGEIFVTVTDEESDLRSWRWSGSAMTSPNTLETTVTDYWYSEQFMLAVPPPQTASAGNLLLAVGNAGSPSADDLLRKATFRGLDYNVTLIDDGDAQATYDSAVAANDVVYVSESVQSSELATKLLDAPIGVVIEEGYAYDVFGLTTTDVSASAESRIDVQSYDHYITQPFSTGNLSITSSSQPISRVTTSIAAGGQVLAEWPSSSDPVVIALETNDQLIDGTRSAGRRVFIGFGGGFSWGSLTADGDTLVERSVRWARALLVYYKLDEPSGSAVASDELGGLDADLTLMDVNTVWVDGRLKGALEFDGSGGTAITTQTFAPPEAGTVTFWMKVPGSPAQHGRLFGLDDAWEVRHVSTDTADSIPYALVFDLGWSGENDGFVTTTTVDTPGKWYFVAASYEPRATRVEIVPFAWHRGDVVAA